MKHEHNEYVTNIKTSTHLSSHLSFVLSDPFSADLDQYDVVPLTDALRGFLQDLPAPIIPATVYSELVYTAQGTVWCTDVNPD